MGQWERNAAHVSFFFREGFMNRKLTLPNCSPIINCHVQFHNLHHSTEDTAKVVILFYIQDSSQSFIVSSVNWVIH